MKSLLTNFPRNKCVCQALFKLQASAPLQKTFSHVLNRKPVRRTEKEPQPVKKTLVCYLCGQHIESSRLLDHINNCLLAWNRREEMKPVDERVPLPIPPDELDQKLPETAEAIEQFNKQMRSAWLKAINIRCKYCHTTLKAGAYFRHIKTCKPPTPDRKGQDIQKEDLDGEKGHVVQEIMKNGVPENAPGTPKEIKTKRNPAPSRPRRLKSLEDASLKAMTLGSVFPAEELPEAPARRKAPAKTASLRQPRSAPEKTAPVVKKSISLASPASSGRSVKEAKPELSHREQLTDLHQSVTTLKARQESRRVIKKSKSERKAHQRSARSSELSSISEKSSSPPRKENEPLTKLDGGCSALDDAIPKKSSNSKERKLVKSMSCVAKGPKGYTCYLCGRQFGKASFHIHHRQCQQLWKDREALKPRKRDRRPLPAPPPEMNAPLPTERDEIEKFNDVMMACYESKALIPCPHCFRTFSQEAFEKHQRICSASNPGGPLGPSKHRHQNVSNSSELAASKPKEQEQESVESSWPIQYCCYLCGRQYGSHSLFLHIPRCQALWESREATKLKKQERRPLPPLPPELEGFPNITLPTDPEKVLEFNNAVYSYWNSVSLQVCPKCGRSFNEESFEKHQRLCTGHPPGERMAAQKKHFFENEQGAGNDVDILESCEAGEAHVSSPNRYTCYLCSKQYGSKSLLIHIPHCEKRWIANEENKPVGERRALPSRPKELQSQALPTSSEGIETFNQIMLGYWGTHAAAAGEERVSVYRPDAAETGKGRH